MTRRRPALHPGPIPGTEHGDRWCTAADGRRYGVRGGPGPDRGNRGFAYVIVDEDGVETDDTCFTHDAVRTWAAAQRPWPTLTAFELDTVAYVVAAVLDGDPGEVFDPRDKLDRVQALKRIRRKFLDAQGGPQ